MAEYRFSAKIVSRGSGQSVIAKAAYNAREAIRDERTGQMKDYSRGKGLEFSGIFAPKNAPEWMKDRAKLWNAVELQEDGTTRHATAQLARNIELNLPHELNADQRLQLVRDFVREQFVRQGMVADVAIHAPHAHGDERNYHAHILLTLREIDGDGFSADKARHWNSKEFNLQWREKWAELGARYLVKAGFEQEAERYSYSHLTLKEQFRVAARRGDLAHAVTLDHEPTKHLGPQAAAMERRGVETERGQLHSETVEANKLRAELRDVEKQIEAEQQRQEQQQRETLPAAERKQPEPQRAETRGKGDTPPALSKTAGEIRMAYSLTGTGQEFANALEDRGLFLSELTQADADHLNREERERLKAKERQAPQPQKRDEWMAQAGGTGKLNPQQLDSANRSYEKWLEKRVPDEKGRPPMVFEKYVDFVQERHAEKEAGNATYERYKRAELVVVDRWGGVHQLTYSNTGDSFKDRAAHLKDIDRAPLFSVADARAVIDETQQHGRGAQAQRLKVELGKTESEIRLAYKLTATGQEFANALEDRGFILAHVNAADIATEKARTGAKEKWQELRQDELVVINQYGNVYRLSDRTTGDEWKARQERLADIDRTPLLSVTQGRAAAEDLQQHRRDERAQRLKVQLGKTDSEIRLAYKLTATGQEFANALEDRGLILAHTTAPDAERLNRWEAQRMKEQGRELQEYQKYRAGELAVVNQHGDVYKLTRSNTGDDPKATAARLKDIDRAALLNVSAAQGAMQQFRQDQREEKEQRKRDTYRPQEPPEELTGTAAKILLAHYRSDSARSFVAALSEKGIAVAITTKEDAERSQSAAAAAFMKGSYAPVYREGEIVAVTDRATVYRLNESTTGSKFADMQRYLRTLDTSQLRGIEAAKQMMHDRAAERGGAGPSIFGQRGGNREQDILDRAERRTMQNERAASTRETQHTVLDRATRRTMENERAQGPRNTRDR